MEYGLGESFAWFYSTPLYPALLGHATSMWVDQDGLLGCGRFLHVLMGVKMDETLYCTSVAYRSSPEKWSGSQEVQRSRARRGSKTLVGVSVLCPSL